MSTTRLCGRAISRASSPRRPSWCALPRGWPAALAFADSLGYRARQQSTYDKHLKQLIEEALFKEGKDKDVASRKWLPDMFRSDRPASARLSQEDRRLHRYAVIAILRPLDASPSEAQRQVAIAQWEFAVYGNLSTSRCAVIHAACRHYSSPFFSSTAFYASR